MKFWIKINAPGSSNEFLSRLPGETLQDTCHCLIELFEGTDAIITTSLTKLPQFSC